MKIITGQSGSGKTHKLVELAIEKAQQGKTSHIISRECSPEDIIFRAVRMSAGESVLTKIKSTLIGLEGELLPEMTATTADVIFVDSVLNLQNEEELTKKLKGFEEKTGKEIYATVQVSRNNTTEVEVTTV